MKKTTLTLGLTIGLAVFATGCAVTPAPFSNQELDAQREHRLSHYAMNQETVSAPITMYEAMARALKYNLDYKVELMEEALRAGEHDLANKDMWPTLLASAGYSGRDNFSGSRSQRLDANGDLIPTDPNALADRPSTSSEKTVVDADLTLSWDLLDFGLSYVRAKQKGDDVLIANERKRKVANRIIENVRTAYWRAVSAQRLMAKTADLEGDITKALASSREVYQRRQTPPLAALTYQRELLTIQQEIQSLQNELVVAKRQLAALMNIDPATDYELVMPDRDNSVVRVSINPQEMVQSALLNRPELREASYRQRINANEATAALYEMLPNLRFYGGFNYSSNDFLYNNQWSSWGAQTSWNVFNVFRYPARKRTVAAQKELLEQRSLALTMAVITQVHVSASKFEIAKRRLETMRNYQSVTSNILDQITSGYKARKVSYQNYVRERMNDILAEAKYDVAHADLQNAFANIYASMGLDTLGADASSEDSVEALTDHLKVHWSERGDSLVYLQ